MQTKIFVALSTFSQQSNTPLTLLEKSGFAHSVNTLGRRLVANEIIQMAKDCKGIIAGVEPYNEDVLARLPSLRCISRCGVGVDNIALKTTREKNITVFTTPDVVIQPVVELTIGLIFDLLKNISFHNDLMKNKIWERKPGFLLTKKTVGIMGLGRIGKRVAEALLKLGVTVCAYDIAPDRKWARQNGVSLVSQEKLFKTADIVTLHLSISEKKPFILGKNEIAMMKKGSYVVNVARGQLIDENALFLSLKSGHLAGAACDVFQNEPYRGKLCTLENIILTPHIATLTQESRLQMEIEATHNIIQYFKKNG